jgi:hypothetical protein
MSSLPTNVSTRWGTASTLASGDKLADALRDLRRRTIAIGTGAAGGWGLSALLLALVLFAWLDLILDLPGGVRLALLLAAVAGGVVVATRLIRRAARAGSDRAMAEKLDAAVGAEGQIVSGVALAAAGRGGESTLTAGLAQLAVARAARLVVAVHPEAIVPGGRALSRPYVLLALTVLGVGVVALVSPRMVGTQIARFADPFGDHPPYSPMTFAVEPGNARVVYGASLDVRATVAGGQPDRVDLVLSNAAEPLPMFPEGDGHWRATLTGVTADASYRVRTGRARSDEFTLGVITVPKLTDVRFHVQLPAYTHRPPYDGPLPQNGIAGLPGTTVEVHAKSSRPLSGGSVQFSPAATPTTAPASDEVVGRFTITASGKATIGVTDVDGQPSTETLTAPITLLRDERPIVRMIEPRAESFATPDAVLKVQALAEDDYGISAVQVFRGLNDSRPRPTAIAVPVDPPPTQFPANLTLALGDYALNPGDVVQLFARAQDTDPAGPKGAESGIVTVRIVSQQDMDRMTVAREGMAALQSKYAVAQRRAEAADAELAKLEKQLAAADPDKPLTAEQQKKLSDQADALAKAAAEVDKLAAHELPFDLDHALTAQLKEMAKAMRDAAEGTKKAGQPGLSAAGALDKIKAVRKQLGVKRDDLQKEAVQPLEHMAQTFPLIEDQARFLDLAAHQKDLADRMAAIQTQNGNDDPQAKAHMRDLQDEQRQVRADLKQLLDDIDDHVAALPLDRKLDDLQNTAKAFAAAVRASPASGDMEAAEAALAEFAGTASGIQARAAADVLDSFIAKCQSMGSCAGTCMKFQPKLAASLGNTVSQMLGSMGLSTGMGSGGAGGYSAMRNSLANVGLYGTLPVAGMESGGSRGGQADHGVRSTANGTADGDGANGAGSSGKQLANGGSDAPVPAQYKQRVGDYFQRVSDELSN